MTGRFLPVLALLASLASAATSVEFNRDIRPILSDKCYTCHGPDAKNKGVPFRLDSEQAAKADLKGHRAIVEGDSSASELIARITSTDKARQMPPVYSGLKLSPAEIATMRQWIDQGAKWEKHWSFIPPKRPELPAVKAAAWPRNAIDNFILARLEREGLAPSPEASRETLIRRVSLDLTGVPPTPAEVDAFLQDSSPHAYEKVVDRLLASPRYGERMAFRWLDAARYADTNGYQYDGERYMWRWRDWVIDAFNRNQPYNQFTLEQIAGDMLPNATLSQKIATGFNRNHRANTEDGIVAEEYAVEYVVDRVETTSTVFLGLTLGCARCHNHKYDPFTQKEFYQVFSYFNNVPELGRAMKYGNSPPMIPAPTAQQQEAQAALDHGEDEILNYFQAHDRAIAHAQAKWQRELTSSDPRWWSPAGALQLSPKPVGEIKFEPGRVGQAASLDGKSYLDAGDVAKFEITDPFSISAWIYSNETPDGPIVTKMVDDAKQKGRGYGIHLDHGKVHVHLTGVWVSDALRVETEETIPAREWHHILMTYSGSRMAEGVHVYIDGKPAKLKVLFDTLYRPFGNAGVVFKQPLRIGAGWGPDRRFKGLIDDVHIYDRVLDADSIAALAVGESLNEMARKSAQARSPVEKRQLRAAFLDTAADPPAHQAWEKLQQLHRQDEQLQRTFPTVMVMAERPTRRETFILVRGAYTAPSEKVQPGVPAVLPPLPSGAPNNRLGFAQWLIDPQNPLLARVAVNRFWQMYFGIGLVKTTEDFGSQGEWPSHPELLDWLATEFVRTGWDMKAMQKLIVTSAAYRQVSASTPELDQRDPDNRLLARGPRFRLPAEMVRDQALAISGLLAEKIGGPSVKPYQPAGLWKEISMQDMDYVESKGADLHRRSLYTFWKRTISPPMMVNFDASTRESCVVRETRTNTPLQALDLMNDVTFLEASRMLAQRMLKEGGHDPDGRLNYGFRMVTSRAPNAQERQVLRGDLQFHLDYFSTNPGRIKGFLSQGEAVPDPALDQRELAAYASVASLMLNLDEAVTKE